MTKRNDLSNYAYFLFFVVFQFCTLNGQANIEVEYLNTENGAKLNPSEIQFFSCHSATMSAEVKNYTDPDPSTPSGVRYFIFDEIPPSSLITAITDLKEQIITSVNSSYLESIDTISYSSLGAIIYGRHSGLDYIVPVLVDNIEETDIEKMFETEDIISRFFFDQGLKIVHAYTLTQSMDTLGRTTVADWPPDLPLSEWTDVILFNNEDKSPVDYFFTSNVSFQIMMTDSFMIIDAEVRNKTCRTPPDSALSGNDHVVTFVPPSRLCNDKVTSFPGDTILISIWSDNIWSLTHIVYPFLTNLDLLNIIDIININPAINANVRIEDYPLDQNNVAGKIVKAHSNLDSVNLFGINKLFDIVAIVSPDIRTDTVIEIDQGNNSNSPLELIQEQVNVSVKPEICPLSVEVYGSNQIAVQWEYLCDPSKDGKSDVRFIVRNSTDSYSLSLTSPSDSYSNSIQNSTTLSDINDGEYHLHLIDGVDTLFSTTIHLAENRNPSKLDLQNIQEKITNPSCGNPNGSIDLSYQGQSTLQYDCLQCSQSDGVGCFYDLSAGNYTITVSTENGCTDTLTYTLEEADSIEVEVPEIITVCHADEKGLVEINTSLNDYSINIGNTSYIPNDDIFLPVGKHQITITSGACQTKKDIEVKVAEGADYSNEIRETQYYHPDTILLLELPYDASIKDIIWLRDGTEIGQGFTLVITEPKNEIIQVKWNYDPNCKGEKDIRLLENEDLDPLTRFILPNVFMPLKSPFYYRFDSEIINKIISFEIMDRWGNILMNHDSPTLGNEIFWDGKINGQLANAGIYLLSISLEKRDGSTITHLSDIHILN